MVQFNMAPEAALAYLAIFSAWFNYAWLVGVVLEHFELSDADFTELVKRSQPKDEETPFCSVRKRRDVLRELDGTTLVL